MSDDEIAALLHGRDEAFAEDERLLLRLSDALAATPAEVGSALYSALRARFSEEALIELSAAAAQENYRARWNRVFDLGSDELFCRRPS